MDGGSTRLSLGNLLNQLQTHFADYENNKRMPEVNCFGSGLTPTSLWHCHSQLVSWLVSRFCLIKHPWVVISNEIWAFWCMRLVHGKLLHKKLINPLFTLKISFMISDCGGGGGGLIPASVYHARTLLLSSFIIGTLQSHFPNWKSFSLNLKQKHVPLMIRSTLAFCFRL